MRVSIWAGILASCLFTVMPSAARAEPCVGAICATAMYGPVGHGTETWQAQQAAAETIDLNSATLADLEGLPGVGRTTAERIIEYRQKSGGFKKVEELMNVKGIGEKSFLKLRPLVSVAAKDAKRGGRR